MNIFATRVWGFGPDWPIITFPREGDRTNLIRKSLVGDRIIFVATQGEPVSKEHRGRILGMAEIGRIPVETLDIISPDVIKPHDYDEKGNFRWPKALPMLRAWRFTELPLLNEVLSKQLPYNATSQAVLLPREDIDTVLSLKIEEVPLRPNEAVERQRGLGQRLTYGRSHGPAPSNWSGEIEKSAEQTGFTYIFRFGKSDAWKIGRTVDLNERLREVNKHIPEHVTGMKWNAFYRQQWPDLHSAHEMEQRILDHLEHFSIGGEMVRCRESDIEAAWLKILMS